MTLFRPGHPSDFTVADARQFLGNFLIEFAEIPFTAQERRQLLDQVYGRLVCKPTRRFFLYHFAPLVHSAVHTLFEGRAHPVIVELGCASGTTSILFALLGARVIGLDFDPVMVSVCRRRLMCYERLFGPLPLEFRQADTLDFDYSSLGPIDGIYSLFALNLMQPTERLLAQLAPALGTGTRFVVSDGNQQNPYNRIFRPRQALRPKELETLLARHGLRAHREFHCTVPPLLARFGRLFDLGVGLETVVRCLGLSPWLSVSYTLKAQQGAVR